MNKRRLNQTLTRLFLHPSKSSIAENVNEQTRRHCGTFVFLTSTQTLPCRPCVSALNASYQNSLSLSRSLESQHIIILPNAVFAHWSSLARSAVARAAPKVLRLVWVSLLFSLLGLPV